MNNFPKVNTHSNYKDKYLDSSLLLKLWAQLRTKRKIQIIYSSLIIIILGLCEILTLLALQEFLVLLTNPSQIFEYQLTNIILEILNFDKTNQLLIPLSCLLIFSVILTLIIRLLSLGIVDLLGASIGNELSCRAFKNIMYQPYETHLSQNSSEIITGVVSYTDAAVKAIKYAVNGLSAFIVSISVIYGLLKIDRNLALISLTIAIFGYFIFGIFTRGVLLKNSRKVADEQINQIKNVSEGLGAIKEVILRNSYIFYLNRFKKADLKVRRALALNSFIVMSPRYVIESAAIIFISIIVILFSFNNLSILKLFPTLGTFALGSQKLLPAINAAFLAWAGLKSQQVAIRKLLYYLKKNNKEFSDLEIIKKPQFKEFLQLKNINFMYKNKSLVLSDINIKIPKGERIGLVGQTGSGKSSLIDIMNGLLKPSKGELIVDGKNIYNSNNFSLLLKWRLSIAYVPQTIFLSDATVYENIAFGIDKSQIDIKKVFESAKRAEIYEYINSLPQKFNTVVGEDGIRLSGGQRQRIGLARAIYRILCKANTLILDEATSALDFDTERKVVNSIMNLDKKLTIIMIAHRLNILSNFDRVIELNRGKVIKEGKPKDILNL